MTETSKNSETSKRIRSWWSKNWFYITLVLVAVIGGGCAFTLPYYFQREGDNIWSLRQAILAATGGVLAILTLWENRRKNIQEKEKNDQDHTRQVHAERRARYAKAIEQLADDKSAIRLGGVYTLAKLVDDWLDDEKTLPSMEKRRQEGQIIIDSLCAYIRSSFPLAERHDELTLSYEEYQQKYQDKNQVTQSVENSADNSMPKAKHQDNKQSSQSREEFVRDKSLFREEQEVRQTILSEIKNRLKGGKFKNKDGEYEIKPGTWSHFDYDFSNAVFFYAVSLNEVVFSGEKISFSAAKFIQQADFSGAIFIDSVYFNGATFHKFTSFSRVHFYSYTNFSMVHFHWAAGFFRSHFHRHVVFSGTHFHWEAGFFKTYFHGHADFYGVHFHGYAAFFRVHFYEDVGFFRAKFSCEVDPSGYNFDVTSDSPYKIETKEEEYNGIKFTIPEEAELFDPDIPSEYEDLTYG